MTVALTILAAAAVLFAVLIFHNLRLRARAAESDAARLQALHDASGYAELLGRTVVIHTTGDRSIRGVLGRSYVDSIQLLSPAYLQDAQPHDLGGEMWLPKDRVAMIQGFDAVAED